MLAAGASLMAGPDKGVLSPKIVNASMFKNGYSIIRREVDVPGPGEYDIDTVFRSTLGTLWFSTSEGLMLDSIRTQTHKKSNTADVATTDALLRANVGKSLTLGIRIQNDLIYQVGKVKGVSGQLVFFETKGSLVALPVGSIITVSGSSGTLQTKTSSEATSRSLHVRFTGQNGKLRIVTMESGLTWSPAFAVDISDPKRLHLVAKSTIVNDLADLKSIQAKFITGFPNVPYLNEIEPLTSNLYAFVTPADPNQNSLNLGRGFGGFGGGGGGGGRMLSGQLAQNAYAVYADPVPGNGVTTSAANGEKIVDLFFYKQPDVTLEKGENAYFVIFKMDASYQERYVWNIDSQQTSGQYDNTAYRPITDGTGEVWHSLEFDNTSGLPLTTGVATTFKDGEIIGQDTLSYVPIGAPIELKVNKALDVRAEVVEEEVTRKRGAIMSFNNPVFDLVTLKGTMSITNRKTSPIHMKINREFIGEYESSDESPVVSKLGKGLRDTNPTTKLNWTTDVAAGEKKTITYQYRIYVRS